MTENTSGDIKERIYLKGETGIAFEISVCVYKQYLNENGAKLPEDIWQDFESFTINIPETNNDDAIEACQKSLETIRNALDVDAHIAKAEINWDETEIHPEDKKMLEEEGQIPDMTRFEPEEKEND